MALDSYTINRANQINNAGAVDALIIEEFIGQVEGTLARKSLMKGWVPVRTVTGTNTIRNDAVGQSTLQVVTPGTTPDATKNDFSKHSLTVDTLLLARNAFFVLDVFQTNKDVRNEVAMEHGKTLGKKFDQSLFIQAVKASLRTESSFTQGSAGKPAGHFGGSQETMALAGDASDPVKLFNYFVNLLAKMEQKDVDPQFDDLVSVSKPDVFYTLARSELLVNQEYVTAQGNTVKGMVIKGYGVPMMRSMNYVGGDTITGHELSNAANSNAYDGDFSKVVLSLFSPRAVLAGETIPLTPAIFWHELSKQWFVDAHMSYGATTNRAEFSGSVMKP